MPNQPKRIPLKPNVQLSEGHSLRRPHHPVPPAREIDLPVIAIRDLTHGPNGTWECIAELGSQPTDRDNPWLTVRSTDLPRVPRKGDILRVRQPQALKIL